MAGCKHAFANKLDCIRLIIIAQRCRINFKAHSYQCSLFSFAVPGVLNITFANVNTTAVRLSWFNPEDQQPYYEYKIHTTDILGATIVETTQSNSTTAIVTGLQPGTGYCFNVTVVVPGRQSAVEHKLGYTSEYF